jgi:hypothetical protein
MNIPEIPWRVYKAGEYAYWRHLDTKGNNPDRAVDKAIDAARPFIEAAILRQFADECDHRANVDTVDIARTQANEIDPEGATQE